jgi:hypothetical protein
MAAGADDAIAEAGRRVQFCYATRRSFLAGGYGRRVEGARLIFRSAEHGLRPAPRSYQRQRGVARLDPDPRLYDPRKPLVSTRNLVDIMP